MPDMSLLANALFTKTQQQVLGLLFAHPAKSFYLQQILKTTGMGVHTIKRELDRMLEAGLVTRTIVGNQHHYQANPQCQVYTELAGIVRKTFGIADVIREALRPLEKHIASAFLYGSVASGMEKPGSDIDLMIIGNGLQYTNVLARLTKVEGRLGRPVNPVIYTMENFKRKRRENNHFVAGVLNKERIDLLGDKDVIDSITKPGKNRGA